MRRDDLSLHADVFCGSRLHFGIRYDGVIGKGPGLQALANVLRDAREDPLIPIFGAHQSSKQVDHGRQLYFGNGRLTWFAGTWNTGLLGLRCDCSRLNTVEFMSRLCDWLYWRRFRKDAYWWPICKRRPRRNLARQF